MILAKKFINEKLTKDKYQNVNKRTVVIQFTNETVYLKKGSVMAYTGTIDFAREGIKEQGLKKAIQAKMSDEMTVIKATTKDSAELYISDHGKYLFPFQLADGESIIIKGDNVTAFDKSLKYEYYSNNGFLVRKVWGDYSIKFTGPGWLVIGTDFEPLTLNVKQGVPLRTDPDKTIMFSSTLEPKTKTDVSVKSILGKKTGEEVQFEFDGNGYVLLQSTGDETVLLDGSRLKKLKSLVF